MFLANLNVTAHIYASVTSRVGYSSVNYNRVASQTHLKRYFSVEWLCLHWKWYIIIYIAVISSSSRHLLGSLYGQCKIDHKVMSLCLREVNSFIRKASHEYISMSAQKLATSVLQHRGISFQSYSCQGADICPQKGFSFLSLQLNHFRNSGWGYSGKWQKVVEGVLMGWLLNGPCLVPIAIW